MKKLYLMMPVLALFFVVSCVSAQIHVGDVIEFGRYEQNNIPADGNEPIEWQVLAVENGRALLISRYGLEVQPYHNEFSRTTWEESGLRQWLNGTFRSMAFTDEESARIIEVLNSNPDNPEIGTPGGNETTDSIFLLSVDEVKAYFPTLESRTCEATDHAKQNGVYIDLNNGNSFWWLRTPGYSEESASIVFSNGLLYLYGSSVINSARMVRPALWLEL